MIKIKINDLLLPIDKDFGDLADCAAKALGCDKSLIKSVRLYRRSIDARRKPDIRWCVSLIVTANIKENRIKRLKNCSVYNEKEYKWITAVPCKNNGVRPIIAGFGPCGMFAALTLARAGLRPVVTERGADVDTRTADVEAFWNGGALKEESNVQFGEGGAGTFSDGKLTTGIKDVRCRAVLNEFYRHGANETVLYDAKPHIGTDILKKVVKNIREEIVSLGGEVRFNSKLDGIFADNGRLCGVSLNGVKQNASILILCCGHSARDTFLMLKEKGVNMAQKPFSAGVRIEHLQSDINRALYGAAADGKTLPPADYKLAVHLENGRGVYTFCMCPGGSVINASSSCGLTAINGMSESTRGGINANSAVLVNVDPADFGSDDPLAGCAFQEKIEKAAFAAAPGAVAVDTAGHFLYGKPQITGKVVPTVRPAYRFCDLSRIFPAFITESLKAGIVAFDKRINGFADENAILSAPETRSSSPVRILRDENGTANIAGLYPAGEGAGYAGGIMSAAVDGIKTAEKIIALLSV